MKNKITTWEDITLDQYLQIYQLIDVEGMDEMVYAELLKVVCGEEVEDLTLPEYKKMFVHLNFLQSPMPEIKAKKEYVLKGNKYQCDLDMTKITGSQYLDYSNYIKEKKGVENFSKLVSVFLIPKGHKYNDGYDIDELIELIESDMKMIDVNAISFFLQRQYMTSIGIITVYSIRTMKKMMKKEQNLQKKEEIKLKIQEAETLLQRMVY